MDLILIFYLSLFLTVFSTPVLIDYFRRNQIMDYPGIRRINTYAVPKMGGVIIYLTAIICILGFFNDLTGLRFFILGSLLLLLVGIVDDIKEVTYKKKFAVQFLSAVFLMIFLSETYVSITLFGFKIPFLLDKAVLFIFIVGVINAVNLYDGLDGLVTSFSLLICFVSFYFGWQLNNQFLLILSAALIGSLIGFLKYNIFPAKIFLGDSGSLTLGFFLVTAVLISSTSPLNKNIDLSFSIILIAVPFVDTLRVMTARIINLKNPFLPDLSHIHHIILNSNINYKGALMILQSFSITFTVIAIYYYISSDALCIFLFVFLSLILFYIRKIIFIYRKFRNYIRLKKIYFKYPA